MTRKFKRLSDDVVVDLLPYIEEKIAESAEKKQTVKLYIGSGHQDHGKNTDYVSVIVMHFHDELTERGMGAHVLYSKESIPRVRDGFTRLWNEVTISLEIAKYLESSGLPKIKFIDLNLNPDPVYQSNNVLRAALGYIKAEGYEPRCKTVGEYEKQEHYPICVYAVNAVFGR